MAIAMALGLGMACGRHGLRAAEAEVATARADNGRTSFSPVGPGPALALAWQFDSGTPRPAWAGEARGSLWQKIETSLVPRAADDLAPVPVVTRDAVVLGTTLDGLFCIERPTGAIRWRRWLPAPVRYAPVVVGNRLFVGADDGVVRALDMASGVTRWERPVPRPSAWLPGNQRLVSPVPIRTGMLVSGSTLYVGAGLFPIEGTWLMALNLADGSERWSVPLGNTSPQGYLVEAGEDILVPNGRAAPALHRRSDGSLRRALASANGTLAVVSGTESFSGPGASGSFTGSATAAREAKIISYPGRHLAVSPGTSCLANEREVLALDRDALRANAGDVARAVRWKTPLAGATAMAIGGDHVFVGHTNAVSVLGLADGRNVAVLKAPGIVAALAVDATGVVGSTQDGRVIVWNRTGTPGTDEAPVRLAAERVDVGHARLATAAARPDATGERIRRALGPLGLRRGWGLWTGTGTPDATAASVLVGNEFSWVFAVPASEAEAWREHLGLHGWLGHRASVVARAPDGSVPVVGGIFNLVLADALEPAEARRVVCPQPSGRVLRGNKTDAVPPAEATGAWTHQYGDDANTGSTAQSLRGRPRLRWFGGHGPEQMPDRHTRAHAPLAAGGLVVSVAEDALVGTDARNGTVRWSLPVPGAIRYAIPYDAGHVVLEPDASALWAAVREALWHVDPHDDATVRRRIPVPVAGEHWGWVARSGDVLLGSTQRPNAGRTRKEYSLVDLDYRSQRPLVCSTALMGMDPADGSTRWRVATQGAWVNPTLAASEGRVFAVEALGAAARTNTSGRLTCAEIVAEARVVCLDARDGRLLWRRPLVLPLAEDILGLGVRDGRLFLSCARSVEGHAAYHLQAWDAQDGRELWKADGSNPIQDLYHGQQVKRPVLVSGKVSFESNLFNATNGAPWLPPGVATDWILRRPGHACGGMTGTDDGLLFRADNPTWFRFSDGSFTRLAPTRPGCWINILPAQGGVVIPEASASCICGYAIQASMAFSMDGEP